MKKIISLVRVLLKLNLNSTESNKKKHKSLLLVAFGIYILFVFSNFWKMFIEPLQTIHQEDMSMNLILGISSSMLLITCITYMINILYFTNDMESIIPFPFHSQEILVAKLIVAYIYELMIESIIALPGFLTYGIMLHQGVGYYILALVVFLLLPIIPIIFLTILYTLMMQFLKMKRYKSVVQILTTVLVLLAVIVSQMQLNANMLENGSYDSEYLLSMAQNIRNYMPYYLKTASTIFESNDAFTCLVSLLWFIVMNFIAVLFTVFAFDRLYVKGVSHNQEGISYEKRKGEIQFRKNDVLSTIATVEMKQLMRNVTYFIQCILPTFFMPVIILISTFSAAGNQLDISFADNPIIKMIFAILIIQFFMMMNQISATAISRDGREEAAFWKTLPFSKMKLFEAKAIPSILVGMGSVLIATIFDVFIFKMNGLEFLMLIVIGVLLAFIQSYAFLLIDLKHPKLQWESEIAVVKHNMNVLKAIGLWFALIISTALIGNVFLILQGKIFASCYAVLLGILFVMVRQYIRMNIEKMYEKIW